MSDDQMKGLKDLLRTESTEPADVTAPTPRPARQARGLSALTGSPAAPNAGTEAPATQPSEAPDTPVTGRPAPHRTSGSSATRSPAHSTNSTVRQASTPDLALVPRRKTSVTLPPLVRDRVAEAYHRSRWTLLALLELAGERLASADISRADVEATVTSLADGGGSASIRSLSVPTALLEQFDEMSSGWRLSRSAFVAACLVLVLDRLPD